MEPNQDQNSNQINETPVSNPTPSVPTTPTPDTLPPQNPPLGTPVTMTSPSKGGRSFIKLLIALLLFVLLAGGAYFAYANTRPKASKTTTTVKKDIAQITYGMLEDGSDNTLYPNAKNVTYNYDVNQQIFEGLVQFKDYNQIKPGLATSWTNPDDLTWDFKLRKNVKFHTGRVMTAADVKYSLENFKTTEIGKLYTGTIKSVQTVNDDEVKVVTTSPDPLLLNKLAFLYIIDSKSALKDSAENGTGPFTVKAGTKPDGKTVELVAFDDWHGGRPTTRALTYKTYPDEDALIAAAQKGEVNIAADIFESKNVVLMKSDSKFKPLAFPNIGQSVFRINSLKPNSPLANKKVRQALYSSLDLDNMLKARGLEGVVANQLVPSTVPGYNPKIPAHKRDVALAKKLLAEAGYPNGVTINFQTLNQPDSKVPDQVVKEAKEAGITVVWKMYEESSAVEADIAAGKLDAFVYTVSTQLLDMSDVVSAYFQGVDYNDPTVNDLMSQANKTLDSAKRLELLQQVSTKLNDDVAYIPLYVRTQHYFTDPSFVLTRDRGGEALGVNFAYAYATETK